MTLEWTPEQNAQREKLCSRLAFHAGKAGRGIIPTDIGMDLAEAEALLTAMAELLNERAKANA